MSSLIFTPVRLAHALVISALLGSGCSSDSPSDTGPVVPEPSGETSTRVDFDITVPQYISNSLEVRLVWDQKDITGTWVGDEFWTASDDFPTNTQNLLAVTFYDGNGAITLGSFEKMFKTGTNASEAYQITADQFDTDRWDSDRDGTSNIEELIAGTDPLLDESLELEVRETYSGPVFPIALDVLDRVSGFYESLTTAARPYYVQTEVLPPEDADPHSDRITQTVNIDLDGSGSGTFSDNYLRVEPSNNHSIDKVATRTNSEGAIRWAGTYNRYDSSAAVGEAIEFTTETPVMDGQMRRQEGVIDRLSTGSASESNTPINISYTLTGTVIDNSSDCEPNAGSMTITSDTQYLPASAERTTTTISKRVDDSYWVVSVATLSGDMLEQYLVPSAGTTFYCDFGS